MADSYERIEPTLNFENIEDVLVLARRLAEEDYQRHIEATVNAPTPGERVVAIEALRKSADAAALADTAYKNFITSGSDFRVSTVQMIQGNEAAASASYKRSGLGIQKSAESLGQFAGYVPSSKMFAGAITAVQKVDQFAAGVEVKAGEAVASFARGLKAFSKGMSDFGKSVAATPERIKAAIKEKAVEVSDAAIIAAAQAEVMTRTRIRQAGSKLDQVVDAVNGKAVAGKEAVAAGVNAVNVRAAAGVAAVKGAGARAHQSAWDTIQRFSDAAAQLKNDLSDAVEQKANTVERHAKAVVGVTAGVAGTVGNLFKQFGRDIAAKYTDTVNAIAAEQAQRKVPQGAAKSVARLLGSYQEDRAAMSKALQKTNVIALGYNGGGDSPRVMNIETLHEINPNAKLSQALFRGDTGEVKDLLQKGVDLSVVYAANIPQEQARYSSVLNHAKTAEHAGMLLAAGANPNATSGVDMESPLSHAISFMPASERSATVIAMLNHGANPNTNTKWVSPMASALMQGDVGITRILLDAGAKVDEKSFAAFAFSLEHKMREAHAPDVASREIRTAENLVKALYAGDRSGMDVLMKESTIKAMMDTMPQLKEAVEKAQPSHIVGSPQQKETINF